MKTLNIKYYSIDKNDNPIVTTVPTNSLKSNEFVFGQRYSRSNFAEVKALDFGRVLRYLIIILIFLLNCLFFY